MDTSQVCQVRGNLIQLLACEPVMDIIASVWFGAVMQTSGGVISTGPCPVHRATYYVALRTNRMGHKQEG